MPDSTEIELKLALVKGRMTKARKLLAGVRFDKTAIDDVYFDTPERDLRRRGLVLRLRSDGGRWLQTLKAAPNQSSLVPVRGEWEVPLPPGKDVPALDLERFGIEPLRILVRSGLDTNRLAPTFRVRTTRRRGILVHGLSEVEVALDDGELHAQVQGESRRQRVRELEVELKSGQPEDVLDLASALVRRSRGLTLVPAVRTKSERGYALQSGDPLDAARASARGFAQQVDSTTSSPAALRGVIRHGLAIVVANADALRQAAASEHVHQARVALRRMRSALRLLDPKATDFPARLVEELRRLASTLGGARDWDVLAEDTLPALLANSELSDRDRRRMQRASARARERALSHAIEAVSARRYGRWVLAMARWTLTAPPSAGDSSIPSRQLLDELAERLFKDARTFARLDTHQRHRVRIRAKRLRYALDLLAARLPERSAADYVDALASLQDSLGELNDAAVALEHLHPLARSREEKHALRAWFARAEQEIVPRASRQLRTLARKARPWRAGDVA